MYETHDGDTGHVLACYPTLAAALADTERLAEAVAAQLAANGEGHRDFWVLLPIYDAETGQKVAGSAYGLPAAVPRPGPGR